MKNMSSVCSHALALGTRWEVEGHLAEATRSFPDGTPLLPSMQQLQSVSTRPLTGALTTSDRDLSISCTNAFVVGNN